MWNKLLQSFVIINKVNFRRHEIMFRQRSLTRLATDDCVSQLRLPYTESSRQMKYRFTVRSTDQTDRHTGPQSTRLGDSSPATQKRETTAAYRLRRLVRFKIVGPLLIQADIIGGVCYLHTLVRALLVQDRITKKNMENLFGRSQGSIGDAIVARQLVAQRALILHLLSPSSSSFLFYLTLIFFLSIYFPSLSL